MTPHTLVSGAQTTLTHGKGQRSPFGFGRIVETTQAREAWSVETSRGDTQSVALARRSPGLQKRSEKQKALDRCTAVTGGVGAARNTRQPPYLTLECTD